MQQLINLVEDRFRRVKQILQKNILNDQLKILKQQQKQRCDKESWVLAMIRLNKNVTLTLKNTYLRGSCKIMKIIDPDFNHHSKDPNIEQNFLNEFVYLYRHFFDKYESQLNFKITIKSLLRPTNHNIVNDMLKYLIDFSRDYYQQTLLWKMKALKHKQYNLQLQRKTQIDLYQNEINSSQFLNSKSNLSYQNDRKRNTLFPLSKLSSPFDLNNARNINTQQQNRKKCDAIKNYDILDIGTFPSFSCIEKDRNNLQYIRLKINQIYKENKYRNGQTRLSYNNYLTSYPNKKLRQQYYYKHNDSELMVTSPFKLNLIVQKNGFSSIYVNICQRSSTRKQKGFGSAKQCLQKFASTRYKDQTEIKHNFNKGDFLINSLRVLRISENFQPNLIISKQNANLLKNQNLPKINIINTERLSAYGIDHQNKLNQVAKKKNSLGSMKQLTIKDDQYNNDQQNNDQQCEKLKQTNSQIIKEEKLISNQFIPQKKFSSKVFSIRKHFSSQDKSKTKLKLNIQPPEEKLLKWLQKMKYAKDMQRKKILGLH